MGAWNFRSAAGRLHLTEQLLRASSSGRLPNRLGPHRGGSRRFSCVKGLTCRLQSSFRCCNIVWVDRACCTHSPPIECSSASPQPFLKTSQKYLKFFCSAG